MENPLAHGFLKDTLGEACVSVALNPITCPSSRRRHELLARAPQKALIEARDRLQSLINLLNEYIEESHDG